jgi:hypothetical protein
MSIAKALSLTVIAVLLFSAPGMACEVTEGGPYYLIKKLTRKPLTTGEHCSFENAGSVTDPISGGPVIEIGGGKIGQAISINTACHGYLEELLFVDCAEAVAVVLAPMSNPYAANAYRTISEMQFPTGPIHLTKSMTVAKLIKTAMAYDIGVEDDLSGWLSRVNPQRRFDYLCGCKLYYPDSAGAKL